METNLHILGCGSATPSMLHQPACQVLEHRGRVMMFDCGEGAQLSVRRHHIKFTRLTDVFISHLHGDHLLGLPGLLSSLGLHDKHGSVTVHIFEAGAELLDLTLRTVCHELPYEVKYNVIRPGEEQLLVDAGGFTVNSFPLYHRVPCSGFRFQEKEKPRHLKGDMVKYHNIPLYKLNEIKQGADYVTPEGVVIPNSHLTTDASPAVSMAYASDTMFDARVADSVHGVSLLYHEATYAGADMAELAAQRGHSTAAQAAEIARMAGVGHLLLGHYSKRYNGTDEHLKEARAIFPDTMAANEGMVIELDKPGMPATCRR
ncbi:MAG: ribonuclease Z [Muribaculaceae bacterium]|nr:ribonuclease Z [Muribaculaceae bacterium]